MEISTAESVIGIRVRIKTTLGDEFEGEIFSYDVNTNCVVVSQTSSHSTLKKTFRVIRTPFIKEITCLGTQKPETVDTNLPPVNIQKIRFKQEQALRGMYEEVQRIGVGVSKEAQDIFNALAKTLPCHWRNDSIVIFDEIILRNPYGVANCSGGDPVMLDRVKKVLEGERRRLFGKQ